MKSAFRIARIFGIEIEAHISWLLIAGLILLSLASHFSTTHPSWSAETQWIAAAAAALLFFASLITHELAHSIIAIRSGTSVRKIVLFLFGGASQLEKEAEKPIDEIKIALAGPFASILIAAVFFIIHVLLGDSVIGSIAEWLFAINLILAIFNLLPGFPLDGGRALRGLIWLISADRRRATNVAIKAGQTVAILMIGLGVWLLFRDGGLGGLWLVFLGWFLFDSARSGEMQNQIEIGLQGVSASDLLTRDCPSVSSGVGLQMFIQDYLLRTGDDCWIVTRDDRPIGIIDVEDAEKAVRDARPFLTVSDAMRPFESLHWAEPYTPAGRILEIMEQEGVREVPVAHQGNFLGIVPRSRIVHLLGLRSEFDRFETASSKLRESSRSS